MRYPTQLRILLNTVLLTTGLVTGVAGQSITGAVVDSTSGTPVGRGFVVLLDSTGAELARALTDRVGRFTFLLAGGGRYRLRSERIAYRRWESNWVEVAADADVNVTLSISPVPVRLASIEVESETQCRLRPEEGRNTAALWDEAEKALRAASWSAHGHIYTHSVQRYSRDLDERRRRVENESSEVFTEAYQSPFRSLAAQRLLDEGYIIDEPDGKWYHAPDANTLLDDTFVTSHCFRVVRDNHRAGMVGLEFKPVPDRKLADVKGVLWLDEGTSELRTIEYAYQNLPRDVQDDRIGGSIEFLQLPSGAWIVHKWQIRMPRLSRRPSYDPRDPNGVDISGFRDSGGAVMQIFDRDGNVVYQSPDLVTITGTVVDSGSLRSIANATVELRGTGYSTISGPRGRYTISGLLDGEYEVEFMHPRLDSLDFYPEPRAVDVDPGDSVTVDLFLPPEQVMLRSLCPDSRVGAGPAIVGMIRNPSNGRGVADVPIVAMWQTIPLANQRQVSARNDQVETASDVWGSYVLCDMPMERTITIEAARDSAASSYMTVRFEDNRVLMSPGIIHRLPLEGFYREGRIWTIDLILLPSNCYNHRLVDGIREVLPTCEVSIPDATRLPPRRRRR